MVWGRALGHRTLTRHLICRISSLCDLGSSFPIDRKICGVLQEPRSAEVLLDACIRNTALLPVVFEDLDWCGDWSYYNEEILRSETLFANLALGVAIVYTLYTWI